MVRITPHYSNGKVHLKVEQASAIWRNRPLMTALSLALIMHIAALLIFQVPALSMIMPAQPNKPTIALAEAGSTKRLAIAADQPFEPRSLIPQPPCCKKPQLPQLNKQISRKSVTQLPVHLKHSPLLPTKPRLQWRLTGQLLNETVLSSPLIELSDWHHQATQLHFSLQVDRRWGEILSVESRHPMSKDDLYRVEKVLRRLRFKPIPSGGIIQGDIEIMITGEDV